MSPGAALLLVLLQASPTTSDPFANEASALDRDPVLRPVHAEPAVAGTFDQTIRPWASALTQSAAKFKDPASQARLEAYFDGRGAVPPEWTAEVTRAAAMVEGALNATHSSGARLPTGWRRDLTGAQGDLSFPEFQHLARLGLLDARLTSDRGDHPQALRRCADVLGLIRDLSWGPLGSAMVAREMLPVPLMVCGDMARKAPAQAQDEFVKAVSKIRLGWGARSAVVRWERMREQMLIRAGAHLVATTPQAGTAAAVADGGTTDVVTEAARRSLYEAMTKLMHLVGGVPDTVENEIAKIDVTIAGMTGEQQGRWLEAVRRLRETEARVEMFHAGLAVQAFRAARGMPPKRWTDVFPEGTPKDPRTGKDLVLDVTAEAARVRATADPAHDAQEIVYSVSGDPPKETGGPKKSPTPR